MPKQKKVESSIPSDVNLPDVPVGKQTEEVVFDGIGLKYKQDSAGGGGSGSVRISGDINVVGQTGVPMTASLTKPIHAGDQRLENVGEPVSGSDAATKLYVDSSIPNTNVTLSGAVTGSGSTGTPLQTNLSFPISAGNHVIQNVDTPSLGSDACNKDYVDNNIPIVLSGAVNATGTAGTTPLATTFTLPIDAGTNKIVNVSEPTASTDCSTKNYVDDSAFQTHDYLSAWRHNDFSTPFAVGTKMKWTRWDPSATESTKQRIKSVGTGTARTNFELEMGYRYKLSCQLTMGNDNSPNQMDCYREYYWFNDFTGAAIGCPGSLRKTQSSQHSFLASTPAVAFIDVENVNKEVFVECTEAIDDQQTINKIIRTPTCTIECIAKLV